MKQLTKEEILIQHTDWSDELNTNQGLASHIHDAMQAYADQQTASMYSEDKVYELLLKERNRAMEIAAGFCNKYDKSYREKHASGQPMAFVQSEMSEVARYIMNAISGKTALNIDTPLIEMIKKDYPLPTPPTT